MEAIRSNVLLNDVNPETDVIPTHGDATYVFTKTHADICISITMRFMPGCVREIVLCLYLLTGQLNQHTLLQYATDCTCI